MGHPATSDPFATDERRALNGDQSVKYIVSAWAEDNGLVLGQLKVAAKSNEITALPELLRALELAGCIVTVDAMGRLLAVLSPPAAEAVPLERRHEVTIGPFTTAIPSDQRVVLDDDPRELVLAMARSGVSLAFVTDPDGRPLGVLFAADVNNLLEHPG